MNKTPEQEAKDLVRSYYDLIKGLIPNHSEEQKINEAKEGALIAVDLVIRATGKCNCGHLSDNQYNRYQKVKQAIKAIET